MEGSHILGNFTNHFAGQVDLAVHPCALLESDIIISLSNSSIGAEPAVQDGVGVGGDFI